MTSAQTANPPDLPPATALERVFSIELVRYFVASALALLVDLGVFSLLLRFHAFSYVNAATAGFIAGAIVAYLFSVIWVFSSRRLRKSPAVEFAIFVAIGVAGLGVTQLVLWLGIEKLAMIPELAKLAAAGATFVFNFLVRKLALFNGRRLQAVESTHD